jgi:hypothetical protein
MIPTKAMMKVARRATASDTTTNNKDENKENKTRTNDAPTAVWALTCKWQATYVPIICKMCEIENIRWVKLFWETTTCLVLSNIVRGAGQPSTNFVWTYTGDIIAGAENNDTSAEGSDEDEPENSLFGKNSEMFEMDRLEMVPLDDEVGAWWESGAFLSKRSKRFSS